MHNPTQTFDDIRCKVLSGSYLRLQSHKFSKTTLNNLWKRQKAQSMSCGRCVEHNCTEVHALHQFHNLEANANTFLM